MFSLKKVRFGIWQNEFGAQKGHRRRNTNYEIKAFVEN
jgi:hypothetical protein